MLIWDDAARSGILLALPEYLAFKPYQEEVMANGTPSARVWSMPIATCFVETGYYDQRHSPDGRWYHRTTNHLFLLLHKFQSRISQSRSSAPHLSFKDSLRL